MIGNSIAASGLRAIPEIRQASNAECGLACIAMIASYYGYESDLPALRRQFGSYPRGSSLQQLKIIAEKVGLSTRPVRCSLDEIGDLVTPCILHWNFSHYVVLRKAAAGRFKIVDPARGNVTVGEEIVRSSFTGVALELRPTDKFKKKASEYRLRLVDMFRFDRRFYSQFSLGLVLTLFAELLVLASPFYLQTVIDEVLLKGDFRLLNVLAIGFGLIIALEVFGQTLRRLTFQYLGQALSFEMSARLVRHLVKLPVPFFRDRQLGDLQHRVQSLAQVQDFLTRTAPELVVDTVFILLIIALMFLYSPLMTGGALLVTFFFLLWRGVSFFAMRQAAGDLIVAESKTQTTLLETLRTMPSVKAMAIEHNRESDWQEAVVRKLNARIRVGNLEIANEAIGQLLLDGFRVIVVFVLASQVFAGSVTVGMMTAFVAYYGMFRLRTAAIVDRIVEFKLLQVPLGRIADIVFSETEVAGDGGGRECTYRGNVELTGVSFRYSQSENWVLRSVNLAITAGEVVAIRGPSGAGKSTLLRLIAGLEAPTCGNIGFDGLPCTHWDRHILRSAIGVVMQEEPLLSGTLSQNIARFGDKTDMDRVRWAAHRANISAEIERFPMGYETHVGDVSSTLSIGQKQRVLLARAFYADAKLLLLDEATANLDSRNEKAVLEAVLGYGATVILVSHRNDINSRAEKIIELHDGLAICRPAEVGSTTLNSSHSKNLMSLTNVRK